MWPLLLIWVALVSNLALAVIPESAEGKVKAMAIGHTFVLTALRMPTIWSRQLETGL